MLLSYFVPRIANIQKLLTAITAIQNFDQNKLNRLVRQLNKKSEAGATHILLQGYAQELKQLANIFPTISYDIEGLVKELLENEFYEFLKNSFPSSNNPTKTKEAIVTTILDKLSEKSQLQRKFPKQTQKQIKSKNKVLLEKHRYQPQGFEWLFDPKHIKLVVEKLVTENQKAAKTKAKDIVTYDHVNGVNLSDNELFSIAVKNSHREHNVWAISNIVIGDLRKQLSANLRELIKSYKNKGIKIEDKHETLISQALEKRAAEITQAAKVLAFIVERT